MCEGKVRNILKKRENYKDERQSEIFMIGKGYE